MSSLDDSLGGPGWQSNLIRRLRPAQHLSDSEVAALTYGSELGGPSAGAIDSTTLPLTIALTTLALPRAHADTCDACRQRVRDARARDDASAMLLSALDVPTPAFDAAAVLARVRTNGPRIGHTPPQQPARVRRSRQYAIAASFLFALIGVTALAFPGSPLRMMLERFGRTSDPDSATHTIHTPRIRPGATETMSSVTIVPAAHLTIEFRGSAGGLPVLTVRYCDTSLASLRVMQPDTHRPAGTESGQAEHSARFAVSADRIMVTQDAGHDNGPLAYELAVPDSTRLLSVMAHGKVVNVQPLHHGQRGGTDRCDVPMTVAWTR